MARPACFIEENAGNIQLRVEMLKTVYQRGNTPGQSRGIDHKDNRQSQPLGHFCRTAGFTLAVIAIKEAHHPFHNSDINSGIMLSKAACERVGVIFSRQHPAIQVSGRNSSDRSVVPRVNKVRTNLERLDGQAAFS